MNIIEEELKLLINVIEDAAKDSDITESYGCGRSAGLYLASQFVEDLIEKLKKEVEEYNEGLKI